MAWSSDEKDARMLLDIPSPITNAINDQFTLKLLTFDLVACCSYHVNRWYALQKFGTLTAQKSSKFQQS